MKPTLILLMMLAMQPVLAGELYRWVDANGKVHYGDVPANDAQQLEVKKYAAPVVSPASDSALEKAKKDFPVTLYVIRNCGNACTLARNLLARYKIPYKEVMLKNQQDVNDFKKKSGSDVSPTLAVGKNWLKGFEAQEWQDELNIAGYPGVAPSPAAAQGIP